MSCVLHLTLSELLYNLVSSSLFHWISLPKYNQSEGGFLPKLVSETMSQNSYIFGSSPLLYWTSLPKYNQSEGGFLPKLVSATMSQNSYILGSSPLFYWTSFPKYNLSEGGLNSYQKMFERPCHQTHTISVVPRCFIGYRYQNITNQKAAFYRNLFQRPNGPRSIDFWPLFYRNIR